MEKVFTNEMSKFVLILGAAVFGLTMLVVNRITKLSGSFKPHKKAMLLYLIVGFLLFSFLGLAGLPEFSRNPLNNFIFLQIFFLLLGILHIFCMEKYLEWSTDKDAFWIKMLFTVLLGIFGSIGFMIVFYLLNKNGMQFISASGILFFVIPLMLYHSFQKAIDIPPKILNEWFYPVNSEIEEPEDSKLKNLLVISFEFQKKIQDGHLTNFRAKAPVDMDFGQLFYYFINDYNERHKDNKIQFISQDGSPQGWIFYKRPKWYSFFTNYIDADKTIFNNGIRENDVIICTRSQI
jgi:hypothetical protein